MTESQVDENTNEENSSEEGSGEVDPFADFSREDLVNEIRKTRDEAKNRRLSNKRSKEETTQKLKEYDEWKKSQMSEVDRLKAEKAEIEETANQLRREKWRANAALKAGLDSDLEELVVGASEEEMVAHAKKLAAKLEGKRAPDTGVAGHAGNRGKPVGSGSSSQSESDWFRSQFDN